MKQDVFITLRVNVSSLEDGRLLLKLERYSAALYLAGYAAECILKAMILDGSPMSRHADILRSEFRGPQAHDIVWLRARLRQAGGATFPGSISKDLVLLATWRTDLRYNATAGDAEEAVLFLGAVQRVVEFCE